MLVGDEVEVRGGDQDEVEEQDGDQADDQLGDEQKGGMWQAYVEDD